MSEAAEIKNWRELVVRLRDYALAVSFLGGLNDLDKALYMAADGIEMYVPGAEPNTVDDIIRKAGGR